MRRNVIVAAIVTAVAGAAIAVVAVVASYWWTTRDASTHADFGWYAYSGTNTRRYVDFAPSASASTDWASLLVPGAIVGAALALVLIGVGRVLYRRRTV